MVVLGAEEIQAAMYVSDLVYTYGTRWKSKQPLSRKFDSAQSLSRLGSVESSKEEFFPHNLDSDWYADRVSNEEVKATLGAFENKVSKFNVVDFIETEGGLQVGFFYSKRENLLYIAYRGTSSEGDWKFNNNQELFTVNDVDVMFSFCIM